MTSKRKRDENELKRGSVSPKAEGLPLNSQELTNYHVSQLQESNKKHRQRIHELESKISEMIGAFESAPKDGNEEEHIYKRFEYVIKQKDDEILSLRNENQRLSMQNVLNMSSFSGCSNVSSNASNKSRQASGQGTPSSEMADYSSPDMNIIDLREGDLRSRLAERDQQISDLSARNEEVSRENLELRRSLALYVPCKSFEGRIGDEEAEQSRFCRCVEGVVDEIFELRSRLKSEKLKFTDLLESELLRRIKEFLATQKRCEEHNKSMVEELSNLKGKYNDLKQDYASLESSQKALDDRDREQKKKIRELELKNSKMESERTRISEFIKSVGSKLEIGEKEEVLESIMNEYEELSNAFEEKSLECDGVRKKLWEKEKELDGYKVGIDEIKQALREMETAKILYEEKLSLIRKTNRNELLRESPNRELNIIEFLNKHFPSLDGEDTSQGQNNLEESLDQMNKSLIEQKSVSEKLSSELGFYKSECNTLREQLNALEKKETNYRETVSVLKNRLQYVLNKVHKLTDLEINIDSTEENEHLQVDDYDKELNHLKSENQELLTLMKCSVCRDKVKDTVINRCGHLFCKECIDNNLSSRNRKCPLCHITFDKNDIGRIFLH
ncbi:hypothetical protein OJ253_2130 [Cryptosporidium canis]|uniref:E3 ubiquitin protein ligase n=1 Tax=Cryptosporidium canis TaxID=195482 RepID=A0A9D5HWY3_9CRYT|nr:hypothetical protein OJ253_2130 [Cryptosporidium canis]